MTRVHPKDRAVKQRVIGPGQILLGFLIVISLQMLLFAMWILGKKLGSLQLGISAFIGVCEVVATNAYAQTLLENRQLRIDQYMMNHRKKP